MGAEHPYFRITSEDFAGHGRLWSSAASTTFTIGGLVAFQIGAGYIRPMQAGDKVLGICQQAKASSDTAYTPLEIEVIFRGAEVYCPVSSGTVGITERGDEADVVNGGLSVTLTESNNDFRLVELIGSETDEAIATCINTVY